MTQVTKIPPKTIHLSWNNKDTFQWVLAKRLKKSEKVGVKKIFYKLSRICVSMKLKIASTWVPRLSINLINVFESPRVLATSKILFCTPFKVALCSRRLVRMLEPLPNRSSTPWEALCNCVLCWRAWSIIIDVSPFCKENDDNMIKYWESWLRYLIQN